MWATCNTIAKSNYMDMRAITFGPYWVAWLHGIVPDASLFILNIISKCLDVCSSIKHISIILHMSQFFHDRPSTASTIEKTDSHLNKQKCGSSKVSNYKKTGWKTNPSSLRTQIGANSDRFILLCVDIANVKTHQTASDQKVMSNLHVLVKLKYHELNGYEDTLVRCHEQLERNQFSARLRFLLHIHNIHSSAAHIMRAASKNNEILYCCGIIC